MVNINDYKAQSSKDKLMTIFERQAGLMQKYHEIEKANGFHVCLKADLHDAFDQQRIKDFAWRITEEMGEALEAFRIHENLDHMEEEIADALHFFVELNIMVGYMPDYSLETMYKMHRPKTMAFLERNSACLTYRVGAVVERLAIMCNTLKNKPWKQSQLLTDEKYFIECLGEVWVTFIQLCIVAKIGPDKLYDLYFRKSKVNEFRQRSAY